MGGAGILVGLLAAVAAGMMAGAGQWTLADGSSPQGSSVPSIERREGFDPGAPDEPTRLEKAPPERDPERFYRKPPRERKPRTQMFA